MCMKWISCSGTEVFGSAIWFCLSCRRLPDSLAELNAKVGALITQSHTTPTLEIELKSKKVEYEKLKNEGNDLKKELIKTKPHNYIAHQE